MQSLEEILKESLKSFKGKNLSQEVIKEITSKIKEVLTTPQIEVTKGKEPDSFDIIINIPKVSLDEEMIKALLKE